MQFGHRVRIDQQDRQLGLRMDAQPGEGELRQLHQRQFVDFGTRLVVDLDHRFPRCPREVKASAKVESYRS
ncbi:hypothetical protein SDC9_122530 [bioreactor metagenome]|uniref:Uncharacterized protein n=1 Tax=bioreactor metagenome TaxID=1076179 RepID=A0A645CF02_9ZZZZ